MAARPKLPIATPDQFEGITLMRMRTENVARTRLVDISIDQTVTKIGGDNMQGKSSFLNALKWIVGGKAAIDVEHPIHDGTNKGTITCDFGDGQTVKMTLNMELLRVGDDKFATNLDIEIPGHIPPSRVQEFLNTLAGKLSFDPLEFDRKSDDEKFELCRGLVGDFDFRQNAASRKTIYDQRTKVNGDRDREYSAAESIRIEPASPGEHVDEESLIKELKDAGDFNLTLERRRNNRQTARDRIESLRKEAADEKNRVEIDLAASIKRTHDQVQTWRDQVAALQEQIARALSQLEVTAADARLAGDETVAAKNSEADALQAQLDAAEELPYSKDAAEIEARLSAARVTNKAIDDWETQKARRDKHEADGEAYAKKSEALTAQIAQIDQERQDAIQKAQLPIEGLSFGDGFLTLNGKRWKEASTAERIDAATAIAMALNPKLKVILIRDGSNLGSAMRERIRQRAAEKGYRVLMEIVDETGANSHFFIEDGMATTVDRKIETAAA